MPIQELNDYGAIAIDWERVHDAYVHDVETQSEQAARVLVSR